MAFTGASNHQQARILSWAVRGFTLAPTISSCISHGIYGEPGMWKSIRLTTANIVQCKTGSFGCRALIGIGTVQYKSQCAAREPNEWRSKV